MPSWVKGMRWQLETHFRSTMVLMSPDILPREVLDDAINQHDLDCSSPSMHTSIHPRMVA